MTKTGRPHQPQVSCWPGRRFPVPAGALGDHAADFATLDPDDQAALLKVLDALVTKTKLRALTAGAS